LKNFKQLRIWLKGFDIAIKSYQLTRAFPNQEKFGLIHQINSAAYSIPSNIAEGSSRSSDRDYHRFIEIALGSSFELETHLLISEKLNFGDPLLRSNLFMEIDNEQKMLIGFMNKLKK